MIGILVNGLKVGIVLTFLVGPVFFTIIQTSIERGFSRGALVAVGVSMSDILYVLICYLGFAQIMADSNMKVILAYGGGVLLIGFGLYHLLVKSRKQPPGGQGTVDERRPLMYIVKGFLINGMTPMVLFFWIGTVSLATINYGYTTPGEFAFFFGAVLGIVLGTDILKAYLADKLRLLLTSASLRAINIVMGLALIFFGCQLLLKAKTITFF
ncbi:MAG TPA: LysE family transporter [Cyclobacteriaceae bacterium]|nr:LysE family transporter [Cyclobacteriaceae bacterium]